MSVFQVYLKFEYMSCTYVLIHVDQTRITIHTTYLDGLRIMLIESRSSTIHVQDSRVSCRQSQAIKENLRDAEKKILRAVDYTTRVSVNQSFSKHHLNIKLKITEDPIIQLNLLHPVHKQDVGENF